MKSKIKSVKSWLKNKYEWLKTFNKIPVVEINAAQIIGKENKNVVNIIGRVHFHINCDHLESKVEIFEPIDIN